MTRLYPVINAGHRFLLAGALVLSIAATAFGSTAYAAPTDKVSDQAPANSGEQFSPSGEPESKTPPYIKKAAPEGGYRIVVLGDSLGVGAWQGLYQNLKGSEDPNFEVIQEARVNTGIVRSDRFNWPKQVLRLARKGGFEIAVLMFGGNDMQSIRLKGKRHHYQTEGWVEHYTKRIDDMVLALKSEDVAVYWMGLPIVKRDKLREDYEYINQLARERMEHHGVRYVDTWTVSADDNGTYSQFGRDEGGRKVKLRARDGVHFTPEGYRRFTAPVEAQIRADVAARNGEYEAADSSSEDDKPPKDNRG
ncbi:MAG: DUF459 domain-containing protein [Pseudomonadota bacterium]